MIEHRFDTTSKILAVTYLGVITEKDLVDAYGLMDDPRFDAEYQVLFDARGATIGFTFNAFKTVENTHGYKNVRGIGTRTAFVLDNHLQRAVAELARDVRSMWGTNWRFFDDPDEARAWLTDPNDGEVDLPQTL